MLIIIICSTTRQSELLWVFVSAPASANRKSVLVANRLTQEVRMVSRVNGAPPVHTTPLTQRHRTSSANESKHAIRSETAGSVAHRRKTTGWTDSHSMATRKEPHMGCHRHRHRRRLKPSSNIDEGWWRCRERRHQEGGQVR